MDADPIGWGIIWGCVALSVVWVVTFEVSRSLDDGWLGDFVKKRRQKKIESEEPEEPPFPLDKPNSCRFCEHNYCTGSTYVCKAYPLMDRFVETWWWQSKGHYGYRTWDRCDDYKPLKICETCKHMPGTNWETHILGDEEVKVKIPPEMICPYGEECKHQEKWEPKGDE